MDDSRFKQAYGKAIAEALLAREEEEKASTKSSSSLASLESIRNTYRAFHYDDPILPWDGDCTSLAYALLSTFDNVDSAYKAKVDKIRKMKRDEEVTSIDSNCEFGLSNRFVQGVIDICTKNSSSDIAKSSKEESQKTDELDKEDESEIDFAKHLDGPMLPSPKENGYCDLAFVVFVLGPLMCCKEIKSLSDEGSWNINTVHQFLEGYTVPSSNSIMADRPDLPPLNNNSALPDIAPLNLKKTISEEINNKTNGDGDEESLKETFAAEEDDDDFDFGSDRYSHETTLQPVQATQVRNDLTSDEAASRIKHLLNELSYARLSSMSETSWKKWNVSKRLIEFILVLQSFGSDNVKDHCNNIESLSLHFNKPLFVLRDRALDERYNHDALVDYLHLVEKLLHINAVNDDSYKMRLDRAVSLSILAGLCSSDDILGTRKKAEKAKIRTTIIKSLDTFTSCIEYVRAKKSTIVAVSTCTEKATKGFNQGQGWMHVVMNIVPILDFFTSIKSQTTCKALDNAPIHKLSKDEGHAMLQSGFFRELILLYTGSLKVSGSQSGDALYEKDFCRDQLLRSTLILSAQCPSHLGKYATRVQELKNVLYSESFASDNEDSILWYALLSHLHSSSQLQMRMKGNVSLTKGQLEERCFVQTSRLLNEALSSIRSSSENTSDEIDYGYLHALEKIVNMFVSVPFLSECWVTVISSTISWKQDTKRLVSNVLKELNAVPVTAKCNDESKKTDEAIEKSKKKEIPVAALRKGCKLLLLSLESDPMRGVSTAPMTSSKTD